jgi:putative ABC transport system substrate-binding protein
MLLSRHTRRREFITLLGGAASWPLAARAQQPMPVVGYLSGGAPDGPFTSFLAAFRQGLGEIGYVEGQNAAFEYRWAEGHYDRLPALAAELVHRKVDLIAASGGDLAARAAKDATSTIPIVFTSGDDPAETGLVASLAHPGGNLTGFSLLVVELHAKRLELISELVPNAKVIALLVNPDSPQTERVVRAMQEAAGVKGVKVEVVKAATESEIDTAFASLSRLGAGALVQQADPFFLKRRDRLLCWRRAM